MLRLALGLGSAGGLIAQAADSAPGTPFDWVQYGVLGLVLAALVFGKLIPGPTHDREVKRGDRLEDELRARNTYIADHVIPLLARTALVLERKAADDA